MALDILVVDDEADITRLIADILEDEGYSCRRAGDSDSALRAIETRRPNLVILDIWLQGSKLDGLEILERIIRDQPGVPVIMISGHGTIETAVRAIKLGAYDFIEKPFQAERLIHMVQRALDATRLRRENEELRRRSGGQPELIGASPPVNQLRAAIERVAGTESRVFISGPPGSGKEIVARLIHDQSRRRGGNFLVVNCATMAPERMEIELFGTEHEADSNGNGRILGTFEQCHGGTLLLDEVCDMPTETQGKIVRVLQEQTFERVGGTTPVSVDVRVLASTNRDIKTEMGGGRFREDLYYRLNVVPISVPPLKTRRQDIPVLVHHFMARATETHGLPQRPIAEDAMAALQAYDWPGNVRQLRNVVEWILIMAPGPHGEAVRVDGLPPEITATTPATLHLHKGDEIMAMPLRDAREVFEREYLMAQVTRFGGNISRTASFVGMERSALHRKLKALGVIGGD